MIIGYFGDGPWAHEALDLLTKQTDVKIMFICARHGNPDRMLDAVAREKNIPFLTHPNINSAEFLASICEYKCDLFVSMSFNQIFRSNILNLPPLGAINCHAGKLPFYRGRNVITWAIINDEPEFGVTVHYINEGIDTGDIIRQACFPITDADDYASILTIAYTACAKLLVESIHDILNKKVVRVPQSTIHPLGFYCPRRKLGDERINWNTSSREIFNFVRALSSPGPVAYSLKETCKINIHRVEMVSGAPKYIGIPGAIIAADRSSLLVKTADTFIRILSWEGEVSLRVGDRLV